VKRIESEHVDVVVSDFHLGDGEGTHVLSSFAYANPEGLTLLP
jgi:hypothetical protein